MLNDSIKTLAENPPPKKFRSYRESKVLIRQLETELGLPEGKPILNVLYAERRIAELQAMKVKIHEASPSRETAAPPALQAVAAPVVHSLTEECEQSVIADKMAARAREADQVRKLLKTATGSTRECLVAKLTKLQTTV